MCLYLSTEYYITHFLFSVLSAWCTKKESSFFPPCLFVFGFTQQADWRRGLWACMRSWREGNLDAYVLSHVDGKIASRRLNQFARFFCKRALHRICTQNSVSVAVNESCNYSSFAERDLQDMASYETWPPYSSWCLWFLIFVPIPMCATDDLNALCSCLLQRVREKERTPHARAREYTHAHTRTHTHTHTHTHIHTHTQTHTKTHTYIIQWHPAEDIVYVYIYIYTSVSRHIAEPFLLCCLARTSPHFSSIKAKLDSVLCGQASCALSISDPSLLPCSIEKCRVR